MKLAVWLAYRRIVRTGFEHLENGRPTLILANHSASFMDAVLMGVFTRRRIHFFARGDVFAHPLANKILRSLGMMPIFRVSEGKENMHRNDDTNAEALAVLAGGGAVLIFAEGLSALEKRLKPLKKGPFRLAALAAAKGIAPLIMPVGINYVRPARIGDDVFLVACESIDTAAIYEASGKDEARLGTQAMRDTERGMRRVVWDARDKETAAIADDILLKMQHSSHFSFEEGAAAIAKIDDPASDEAGNVAKTRVSPVVWIAAVLLSPLWLTGRLFHFIPYRAALAVARKTVKAPDFFAPVLVGAAVLLTLFWYLLCILLLLLFWKPGLLLLAPAAACGIFYRRGKLLFLLHL